MAGGETVEHRNLKRLALSWAREQGYSCGAFEVSLPHSGYRADVAAYKPARELRTIEFEGRTLRRKETVIGTTAVFECKQARSDLLKDSCLADRSRKELERLDARRMVLERLLKVHLPSAANGDSLFQEYQTYSFGAINHDGYRKLLKKIGALQSGIFLKNKFEKMVRYRCANLFYIVTTDTIIANYELPLNWGLLVKQGDSLNLIRKPVWQEAAESSRLAVLQRIAAGRQRNPARSSE